MITNHMKCLFVILSLTLSVQAAEIPDMTDSSPELGVKTEEKVSTEEKPMSGYLNIETDETESHPFLSWNRVKKGGKKIAEIQTMIVLRPIIIVTTPVWLPVLYCLYKGSINHYL